MKRLLASLFANRRNDRKPQASTSRRRRAGGLRVETLEGRQLLAAVPAGPTPAACSVAVTTPILNYFNAAMAERTQNEGLAVTDLNDAAYLAQRAHSPYGLLVVAYGWANLPRDSGGYSGSAAANFYSQAVGACEYWMFSNQGTGSGGDYAWGTSQLHMVLNDSGPLVQTLNSTPQTRGSAGAIEWTATTNQNYLAGLEDQSVPPIAGGTWNVNIGGAFVTFNLTQNVGHASGQLNWGGRTGTITVSNITDMNNYNPATPAGTWFGGFFTVQWNDGGAELQGFAQGSPQSSNWMSLYLLSNTGQYSQGFFAQRSSS